MKCFFFPSRNRAVKNLLLQSMSDSETSRSPDRERSPVRARSEEQERQDQEDAAPAEFKCFVGGISFQYNDEELKNGAISSATAAFLFLIEFLTIVFHFSRSF